MLPSPEELRERYASWPNGRLLQLLHEKEAYTEQAVEVARAELGQRNLTVEDVDIFLEQLEERRKAEETRSRIPLTFWEKTMFFFICFAPLFTGRPFRLNYSEDGLLLKAKQSHVFALAGFIALLLDGIITVWFHLALLSGMLLLVAFFLLFTLAERKHTYILQ